MSYSYSLYSGWKKKREFMNLLILIPYVILVMNVQFLSLVSENNVIKFCLLNSYYYDSSDGMVYKSDKSGRKEINNLILPTTYKGDTSIYYELHLKKFSASESDFIFKSYATFDVKWFGSCGDSYFCVSSIEELLEDVNYSGGVIVY